MGNTTNYVIILTMVYLVCGLITLGVYSTNPDSNLLLGNTLFNEHNNELLNQTTTIGGVRQYSFAYNNTGFSSLSGNAQLATTDFKVPDWTKASNNWFNQGLEQAASPMKTLISFVGAPYTLLAQTGMPTDVSALLGVALTIISTLIFANWLFGRDT